MYSVERDRKYAREKVRKASREPFAVRRGNWKYQDDGKPPICTIHDEEAVWHKNKARESGGQWACRTCQRLKSRGLKRKWKTEHTNPFEYNVKRSITMARFHSKKIGREFGIRYEDVEALWKQQGGKCAISGLPMEYIPGNNERERNKVTIDRINPKKGYTLDNIWLVCDWVNRAKSDLTSEELVGFASGILNNAERIFSCG